MQGKWEKLPFGNKHNFKRFQKVSFSCSVAKRNAGETSEFISQSSHSFNSSFWDFMFFPAMNFLNSVHRRASKETQIKLHLWSLFFGAWHNFLVEQKSQSRRQWMLLTNLFAPDILKLLAEKRWSIVARYCADPSLVLFGFCINRSVLIKSLINIVVKHQKAT